jgi:hypothetical protein
MKKFCPVKSCCVPGSRLLGWGQKVSSKKEFKGGLRGDYTRSGLINKNKVKQEYTLEVGEWGGSRGSTCPESPKNLRFYWGL